ncbi:MAG TPA: hypothetical protein VNT81_05080, partial [Vicinamibacterales bacterium]|nr:hypothetical protein [Vicinamibacterales bacterium]
MSVLSSRLARGVLVVAGLGALLWAQYFLRHTLEQSDTRIYSFFEVFFATVWGPLFSADQPWWKLLVPIPELGGAWVATTLIVTRLVEMQLTPPVTWYVFNALLLVASFALSWFAFRSLAFSFTLAICMGFGTQLYATYGVPGAMGLLLLLIYYEVALLAGLRMVQGSGPVWFWRGLFVLSVLVMAIGYEGWLDFASFLWLAIPLTAIVARRFNKTEWIPGLRFGAVFLAVVCVVYVYVKVNFGYGQMQGSESDVIFNYPTLAPKLEDFMSNVVSQLYIVLTNFLPGAFASSTAFLSLGGDELVRLQGPYNPAFSYLVVMQSMFLWRYYAGAAFVVFSFVMYRVIRRSVTTWSADTFAMSIFLLMTFATGATHAIVKARAMNSMPLLGYHVIVGVLGIALVLSLIAKMVIDRRRPGGVAVVALIWVTVFYSALSRPEMLGHMASQVGLGEGIYPNPRATLAALMGGTAPAAPGAVGYHLTKLKTKVDLPAGSFGAVADPLPSLAPPMPEWTLAATVTGAATEGGYRVTGDETEGGYQ